MTTKEIREKSTDALQHELTDQQKHLFDLRSQAVTEKLEDPSQLLKVRRDIARMKTILRQRDIEQEQKGANGDQPKVEKKTEPKTAKKSPKKTAKKQAKKTVRRTVKKAVRKQKKAPATK
jgi:large subunit ribosomal protein L29